MKLEQVSLPASLHPFSPSSLLTIWNMGLAAGWALSQEAKGWLPSKGSPKAMAGCRG